MRTSNHLRAKTLRFCFKLMLKRVAMTQMYQKHIHPSTYSFLFVSEAPRAQDIGTVLRHIHSGFARRRIQDAAAANADDHGDAIAALGGRRPQKSHAPPIPQADLPPPSETAAATATTGNMLIRRPQCEGGGGFPKSRCFEGVCVDLIYSENQ